MLTISQRMNPAYSDMSDSELEERIGAAKAALGDRALLLGHHYQREEVMRWCDVSGDSFGLSQIAASKKGLELVVFCGVHFMAESADILTGDETKVILPDLAAGCSMADMADIEQVTRAWEDISEVTDIERVLPITYMNSSADLKAFVGERGGVVCTSSNARAVLEWAFDVRQAERVLFFPDQHLGRNTARGMGITEEEMPVWDPAQALGGLSKASVEDSRVLLWKGHCSVHQRFSVSQIERWRAANPKGLVVVHPECSAEVVEAADASGSTDFIIKYLEENGEASVAIGTEINLVARLARRWPGRLIECLDDAVCPCVTMSRIDAPHLAWVLEEAVMGRIRNQIRVEAATAAKAKLALDRMLAIC